MNNKNKKTKKKLVALLLSIGVIIAVIVVSFIFQDTFKTVATDVKTSIENQGKPKFVFDTAKFPDWATAGNVYTNPDDVTDDFQGSKDDLPISGIIVSQCKMGSNCNTLVGKCKPQDNGVSEDCRRLAEYTTDSHCFVSLSYYERKVDPEQEVAKYIEHNNSFGSMTITEAGVKSLTMDTPDGNKEYTLHYYDYESKTGDTIKRGNAIGYVALTSGHIDVRSVCTEASQLDETLPILSAIQLKI